MRSLILGWVRNAHGINKDSNKGILMIPALFPVVNMKAVKESVAIASSYVSTMMIKFCRAGLYHGVLVV